MLVNVEYLSMTPLYKEVVLSIYRGSLAAHWCKPFVECAFIIGRSEELNLVDMNNIFKQQYAPFLGVLKTISKDPSDKK